MAISRKSREDIKLMRRAGHVVALVHEEMRKIIQPGVTTLYLDKIAHEIIKDNKCFPTFKGYNGFPASICTSVNEEVVHGIPSDKVVLKEGDIISVDIGATYGGLIGDSAWTYGVGEISQELRKLLEVTEKSLYAGIEKAVENAVLDAVSGEVEKVANEYGYGIVRQYGGHGVGRSLHEDPFIFNYKTGNKTILKSGMTIAIEPMLNLGKDEVFVLDDDWTVVTKDKMPSAHFEHTILITDTAPELLTKLNREN